jgi:hypothetical protein
MIKKVGLPGFEPGSPAPKAGRIRPSYPIASRPLGTRAGELSTPQPGNKLMVFKSIAKTDIKA